MSRRPLKLVPLPEQFYDIEQVAKPLATRWILEIVALVIYIGAVVCFVLGYQYFSKQIIELEETSIVRQNSVMGGYDCTMMLPVDGGNHIDYEFTAAVSQGLAEAIPYCNSSLTIDTNGCSASECPETTTYSNMFFPTTEACTLGNASVWNRTIATDDGMNTYFYARFVADIGTMSVTTPRFRWYRPTNINCTVDKLKAGIIAYYTGNSTGDSVARACQPFKTDANPPYSCERTVKEPMYELLDIIGLAVGNTQLVVAVLVGFAVAMTSVIKGGGGSDITTFCCTLLCGSGVGEDEGDEENGTGDNDKERVDGDGKKGEWCELKSTSQRQSTIREGESVGSLKALLREVQEELKLCKRETEKNKKMIAMNQQTIQKLLAGPILPNQVS